jgi:hypothetical protein
MNVNMPKAAIFAGWKDMDQYMRDNKIEGVEAKGLKPDSPAAVATGEEVVASPATTDKKSAESKTKSKAKPAAGG